MKNALGVERSQIPAFNNLKTLKLGGWRLTDDLNFVAHLLLRSPVVEKLVLLYQQVCVTLKDCDFCTLLWLVRRI
jgi:hypothetical protein